ncbi:MAG TPA: hypothetical protein ENJ54_01285 [Chloroflexi bacterium]|nr:hypothetical protein [Chloroflexota bacterium]
MPDVLGFQVQRYHIQTPVYQGPLDLLLQLIARAELDITKIALAQITDQYLAYLEQMEERSPEEVSAFLVIAAKLVQIKSEALLPRPPEREEAEEDPGEALVQQLKAYRRFKQAAQWLAERHAAGWHAFVRLTTPPPAAPPQIDLHGYTVEDVAAAARGAFQLRHREPLGRVIRAPKITIRQKIRTIIQALAQRGQATFSALLGHQPTRLEAVVTFLALLELVKQRLVQTRQATLFGEIEILPAAENLSTEIDIASEFGE